jgi:antitoxin MazE
MRTTVSKWGNSMALRIPKSILDENKLQEGSQVEIISKDGKIILEPQEKKVREGWEKAAMEAHQNDDDKLMMDFSNEFDKEEWTW